MNTCVSDDDNIVNIQGIRYVSWGESSDAYVRLNKHFFVSVTYKGNHNTFYYKTEEQARSFFKKIRAAMDKSSERLGEAEVKL